MGRRPLPAALLVAGLAAGAGAVGMAASGGGEGSSPSRLIFREDFNGSRLAAKRWNTCFWWASGGCTNAGTHERQWYRRSQVKVGSGALSLVADRRTVRGSDGHTYRYVSGMISSGPPHGSRRSKFAFRYGRVEFRARTPAGRGLWPALWLLAANRKPTPEIDVLEMFGQRPARAMMFLHYRDANRRLQRRGGHWTSPSLRSGWHTYAIDWRPRKLVWLIDGVPRFQVKGDPVPNRRMYLLINLAVGGEGPGPPRATTPFPSSLKVDYVEVRK
jgi:beta-glucanase (GH16 family)